MQLAGTASARPGARPARRAAARRGLTVRAELLNLQPRRNPLAATDTGSLTVYATSGEAVPVATATAGKTVVALIRHFG